MITLLRTPLRRLGRHIAGATMFLLTLMATFVAGPGAAVARDTATCSGKSILPDLASSHPEIYRDAIARAKRTPNTEAVLWRVSKPDQPNLKPSYLFGTMHVADKRIAEPPAAVRKALEAASIVALEVEDISPKAMMEAIGQIPQLIVYLDGSRLDQKMSADQFKKVENLVTSSGLPPQMAAMIRPWLVMTLLATPECEKQRVAAGATVLDGRIAEIAKSKKIPIVGLETIKSQLEAMAGVPEEDQLGLLRLSLAFANQREDQFETLIEAYEKRQLGIALHLSRALAKIAGVAKPGIVSFEREVIYKRNQIMFETSQPLVDRGNAFIAVGALHIVGEKGLVAMYRAAGFTVSPVI